VAGCATAANLTAKYTTAEVWAHDSTCTAEDDMVILMTCAADALNVNHATNMYCNDIPLYCYHEVHKSDSAKNGDTFDLWYKNGNVCTKETLTHSVNAYKKGGHNSGQTVHACMAHESSCLTLKDESSSTQLNLCHPVGRGPPLYFSDSSCSNALAEDHECKADLCNLDDLKA